MKITYPHTIENGLGEKIIFHSVQKEPDGDRVIVENFVTKYKKFEDAPEPVKK